MKSLHSLFALGIAALTVTACSNDDNLAQKNDGKVAVKVSSTITRAYDAQWEKGDNIGLVMLDPATNKTIEGLASYKYSTANGDGSFQPASDDQIAYYPAGDGTVDLMAYYPYTASFGTDLMVPVSTADQSNLPAIDLMTSDRSTGHNNKNVSATLNFGHRLSKISILADKETSVMDVDLTGATLTLAGTATTAQWSLIDGTLNEVGKAADINIPTAVNTDGNLTATGIVIPTEAGKGVTFVIKTKDGREFTAPIAETTALESGKNNIFRIHLGYTGAKVGVTIKDWEEGGNLELSSLRVGTDATDGNAANVSSLELWIDGHADNAATYNWASSTSEWYSNAPFYLDYLSGNELFFARHIPTAENTANAISGLQDIVGNTTAAPIVNGKVNLSLQHLFAQVNIKLLPGEGLNDAFVEGADVKLNSFKNSYILNGKNVLTPDGDSNPYSYTTGAGGTVEGDGTAVTSILIVPQALTDANTIVITKGGATYTMKLNSILVGAGTLTSFEGGKSYNLTITVTNNQLYVSATLTPWTEITGSGTADPDMDQPL